MRAKTTIAFALSFPTQTLPHSSGGALSRLELPTKQSLRQRELEVTSRRLKQLWQHYKVRLGSSWTTTTDAIIVQAVVTLDTTET